MGAGLSSHRPLGRVGKRSAPTPKADSPTGQAEAKDPRVATDLDPRVVGMIQGFMVDERLDLKPLALTPDLEIDWDKAPFDEDQVREGKCKDINTMIAHGLFEAMTEEDVMPGWK